MAERNGRTIVTTGYGGGYVQRPYISRGGQTYYQRTYVDGGHTYVHVYRGYYYHGARFYEYVPTSYYHPVFYGWAYNPWVAPVYYSPVAWGWAGSPWWGFYGGYFTPDPVYATASLWLTDYLIAANLQAAYQVQAEANAAAANAPPPAEGATEASAQTPLTPEIKQAIADEIQRLLASEKAAAAPRGAAPAPTTEEVPDALNPAERVFVVASSLDVAVPASGQECSLTAGAVVMRLVDAPDANQTVTASIQSTKKADCPTGQTVAIGVQDLQEMHNQFQAQLDAGLKTLADKGGTGGLPKPPDTATTGGDVPPPTPDSSAAPQLVAQQQAEQTVAQVHQQVENGQSPTAMAQNAALPSLKDQLEPQYRLTETASSSGQLSVIQPGTVLVVQLGGIQGVPPGSMALAPAVFKDGVLRPPSRKSDFGGSLLRGISKPGAETSGVSDTRGAIGLSP